MARAAARRPRTRIIEEIADDPVDDVMGEEHARVANDLSAALDSLAGFTESGTKFVVSRIPRGVGKWEWCFEVTPPIDAGELMERLQDEYGPGDYAIRVHAGNQIKTTRYFAIAAKRRAEVKKDESFTEKLLLALVSGGGLGGHQPAAPGIDMAALMAAQAASADRQMALLVALTDNSQKAMATLVGALSGNKGGGTAETLTALAPYLTDRNKGSGLGELVEGFKMVRELLPAPAAAEEDTFAGMALKAVSPHLGDLTRGFADFAATRRGNGAEPVSVEPMDYRQGAPAPAPRLPAGTGRFPVLAELAGDVLFYFSRRMHPDIAADGLVDVLASDALKAKGYTEADVVPLLTTLQSAGPKWLDELALEGIDLRADPAWATAFLNALISVYRGDDPAAGRPAGGEGDASGDGQPGSVGISANAGAKPGAGDHERAPA